MTRRNIELLLLCAAAPLVILLFALLAVTQGDTLGLKTLGVPAGIFVAFILAHLAARKFAPGADPAILPICFALASIGIAFVTRLAPEEATGQVVFLFVGVACMVAVLILLKNLDKLAEYKYTLMIVGFLLLLSPMIPGLGQELYGSRIWLSLGPFSFQPGEIAKVVIVLFLAGYLAANREMLSIFTMRLGRLNVPDLRTLMPLLIMWGIAVIIVVFEKDLGCALVFFFVFITMLYVASGRKLYLVIGLGLAAIAAVLLYLAFGHVQIRVQTWLDPFADSSGTGYQLCQAVFSMADGGLVGTGIGKGLAWQIPVVESDYIFAAIAEETGLLGASGLLLLYICLAVRGFTTAARAKSDVSSFVAVGLTSVICLQAFIIVGGVTRLIPLTGLTLPFVSQGGSSLLASFISIGLLMRAGDEGTGIEAEMTTSVNIFGAHSGIGDSVLGRVALGKRLTGTMIVFAVLFALLIANLTGIMVVRADYFQNMACNNHTILREQMIQRGTISTADGTVLAKSVKNEDGTYSREYPEGSMAAHAVGYASVRFGTSGIESSMNKELTGSSSFATWTDALAAMSGSGTAGNDVTLTINSKIQRAAEKALSGRKGACVVMNPQNGAVLGMASSPTFDLNDVETLLDESADGGKKGDSSLFNRATQAQYAPGSTFKIVSLSTALENGIASTKDTYKAPGKMTIGGREVSNFEHESYGTISLARATEVSSNTVFGQLGVQIGAEKLVEGAELFGFGLNLDFELPVAESLMPEPGEMTDWETAWAAAGEPVGEHESPAGPQATVLEMCMVACGIANDGVIMAPYLVDGIYNANGECSFTANPEPLITAVSKETADKVTKVMKGVVSNGTGYAASVYGVTVAGKTGTAEKDGGNDSWFIGFADAGTDEPSVAIAIIIEDGESGIASQKAQFVLEKALQVQGVL